MSWLSRHIERLMRKAEAEGQLSGLEGEGEPLPDRVADASDPAVAVAMRIMAEAGALPEEFKLAKELEVAKADYTAASEDEKPEAMRRLAELSLKHAIAREARKKFMS
ncbi:DnaJ family domain-containing protein [Pseudooceanicola onchidii]|uniref:DnaJ family domain-containing protein n=1 Tax=Pseudooceanicola onchidii TaxID=2562279 RepID=UPI0010AB02B3|nr:DnaJ family domain-containing protein [Pseudooceanicola onchidii]